MRQAKTGNGVSRFFRARGSSRPGRAVFRGRTVLVAALSIGLGVSTVEASTASAATWNLPAGEIAAATGLNNYLEQPEIAIAADGTATVVWNRRFNGSDFVVQAATRPPGANTFGPVEDLSSPIQVLRGLEIAVAPDGETTVVWSRSDGSTDLVQARTRPAGSNTFGAVEDLSSTAPTITDLRIAVAANGETTVVWTRNTGLLPPTLQATTRPAGSNTFGAVEDLTPVGQDIINPEVAVAPNGETTVVWTQRGLSSNWLVQARTRPAGSNTFGAVEDLASSGLSGFAPKAAAGPNGETTVVWTRGGGSQVVQARTRPAGSNTFGDAQDLSVANLNSSNRPDVAIAANGETTVLWTTFFPGSGDVGQARTRPAGSSAFGAVEGISEVSNQSVPRLAVAPDGAATVIWEREDVDPLTGLTVFTVQTASRPAGSSAFGAVTNLSAAGAEPTSSRVATAPDGSNTAVWVQAGTSLQVASSDPTTYPLAVQLAGKGEGKVASSPAGIECGSTCEALFKLSTKVTLTATPAPGSSFTGWSGAGCSGTGSCVVTMSEARSVTATFSGKKPKLGLSLGGPKKVRAGRAFRVGIRVTNRGAKKPTPVGSRATKAETVKTCLEVPRKLFVTRVQKGAKTRGRTICWTRASLGTSKWVSYKVSLRSSSYSGGSEALRASATANGESGTTTNASRSLKIRLVDPRPAPKPFPPTD